MYSSTISVIIFGTFENVGNFGVYSSFFSAKCPSPHFSMLQNVKLFQLGHFFTLKQRWNWVKGENVENIQKFEYILSKVLGDKINTKWRSDISPMIKYKLYYKYCNEIFEKKSLDNYRRAGCWTKICWTEKSTSKNEFIFHPEFIFIFYMLQNIVYVPWNSAASFWWPQAPSP